MIKFLDAVKYHKDLPHQIEAWEFLQRTVHKEVLDEFARLYRNEKITVDSTGLPEEGLKLIKEFEGFSEKTYYDPHTGGLPITAAYGSTRKLDGTPFYIGETITREEGEKLLIHQLKKEFLPALEKIPYWNEMNDEMKGAILSFAYNLGANFYNSDGFNTITRVLRNKEWTKVPETLKLYRNPGSSVEAGLLRRRIAEGNLFKKGLEKK
jgi:GH24 family phage-related lysozyme (muramidase)